MDNIYLNKKYIRKNEQEEIKKLIEQKLNNLMEKQVYRDAFSYNNIIENNIWNSLREDGVLNIFPSNLYDIIRDVMSDFDTDKLTKIELPNEYDDDISVFYISDIARTQKGFGRDNHCLNAIIEFITSSKNKDSISLNWVATTGIDDETGDIQVDGDVIISIYSNSELKHDGEKMCRDNRTCSNWDYANDVILTALGY